MGRAWNGFAIEAACPCPKAPCGLAAPDGPTPECEQHNPLNPLLAHTMRQMHKAEDCPALGEPGCVFCEKVADGSAAFDSVGVYNFEPLNPVAPGHRLFVPRAHLAAADSNPRVTGYVFESAARYAARRGEAFNLIVNNGADAGQTVLHLHVHYVPRRADDGLHLPWTGQEKIDA
jgi:diadenosine tetraphosphate (Ap4A) HIT family hydrolase